MSPAADSSTLDFLCQFNKGEFLGGDACPRKIHPHPRKTSKGVFTKNCPDSKKMLYNGLSGKIIPTLFKRENKKRPLLSPQHCFLRVGFVIVLYKLNNLII